MLSLIFLGIEILTHFDFMVNNSPLVTIAIPTCNREILLARAISSAQMQTYQNIEIVISDNESSDGTESLCEDLATQDGRIRYTRQPKNLGGAGNFNWLLSHASGEYFMWLGDDDWLDANYVESCLSLLLKDSCLAFVSGCPVYYRKGVRQFMGRVFDVFHVSAKHRIHKYLSRVTDNGVFYGLFRRESIQGLSLSEKFAGDWFFLCDVLIFGGFRMVDGAHVHRELGGATESYERLTKLYKLPVVARFFPSYFTAQVFRSHMLESLRFSSLKVGGLWSTWMTLVILARPITNLPYRFKRKF